VERNMGGGGVRCRARGKWDCESVMMLCVSKGDEIEGWKKREKMHEAIVVHRSAGVACTSVGHSA